MGQLRLGKEKGLAQGHNRKSVAEPEQTLRADLPAPIKFHFCTSTLPVLSPYQGLNMALSLRPTNHRPTAGPGQQQQQQAPPQQLTLGL